jgi:phage shock protein PspC (stress-responsive transcriptional regulator)
MTTTDAPGMYPPPPSPSSVPTGRVLRRSRTGRVGAGVASGLGEYFGVDPVLFRVLFATSAFFGGAGVIAYLLAWAAIPDEGTQSAPIDRWIAALRRRRVPVGLVLVAGALLLWAVAFSWWAPGPFLLVLVVIVLLIVVFGRRDWQAGGASAATTATATTVDLTKDPSAGASGDTTSSAERPQDPAWLNDLRGWVKESRAARRERRRRALPLRVAMLVTLISTLIVLGTIDAVTGIALPVYFWSTLGIVVVGLTIGIVLRRTPWSLASLLAPAAIGLIAFAGSHASLHDGSGDRQWQPASAPAAQYRLAFGQGVLDLTSLSPQSAPRTIDVTMAAGEVQIIAPKTLNLTVHANIHLGQLNVDGSRGNDGQGHGGVGLSRVVDPPAGATGPPVTVNVHLADGVINVDHR